jgi:quercetin dioxygenase-like cupin family protein
MKRNKFVGSLLSFAAAPMVSLAQPKKTFQRKNKGFKISAGEGRIHGHIKLQGVNSNVIDVKVSGSDTNGDLAIFEQTSFTQGRGTPLHVHPAQDEIFYILDGSYKFKVGEDLYDLTVGDNIFLPRQVPHAWTQISEKGKMYIILQPAGKLENFFVTIAALDHVPTPAEVEKIFAENEMKVVGPTLKID